jgi:hypothetical protein
MTGFFISLCTLRDLLKEKNSTALCKGEILPFLYERTNQKTWRELPNSFTKPACWFFHSFLNPGGYNEIQELPNMGVYLNSAYRMHWKCYLNCEPKGYFKYIFYSVKSDSTWLLFHLHSTTCFEVIPSRSRFDPPKWGQRSQPFELVVHPSFTLHYVSNIFLFLHPIHKFSTYLLNVAQLMNFYFV